MNQSADMSEAHTPRNRARPLLMVYLVVLTGIALWAASSTSLWEHLQRDSDASNWLVVAIENVAVPILGDTILFLPFAFLCAAAIFRANGQSGWGRVIIVTGVSFVVSLALSLLFKAIMSGLPLNAPSILAIMSLIVICSLGSWAGATWAHLQRLGRWLLLQLFSTAVIFGAIVFVIGRLGLQSEPIDVAVTPVQSRERIELVRRIQQHAPHRLEPGETTELTLSESDLNKLITWGLSLLPRDQNASIEVQPDLIALKFSEELPPLPLFDNVLNVRLAAVPLTKRGELGLAPREFSIGQLQIPSWLLRWSGPIIVDKDWHNDATEPFFAALNSINVDDGQVTIAYGHLDLPDGFLNDALVSIGVIENIGPAMNVQVENLLQLAQAR